jgi:hypothetical protein
LFFPHFKELRYIKHENKDLSTQDYHIGKLAVVLIAGKESSMPNNGGRPLEKTAESAWKDNKWGI